MNESFIFYKSFYDAIKDFDNDTIAEYLKLVCQYALDGDILAIDNKVARALFQMTIPQIDANRKRRENGKKGGAPNGNTNAKKTTEKQPKNNQKQPNVNDNVFGYINPTNVGLNNQEEKEKKNNINIIPKKEKSFSEVFDEFKTELLGENAKLWRETVDRLFGVKNHSLALDEFKAHVIAQGKEQNVTKQSMNEFKAYFSNSARLGFLSEQAKTAPPEPPKRKPCEFYTQRHGRLGVIGVINQDGKTYYVPMEVGVPPSEQHFWNPQTKKYEVQT